MACNFAVQFYNLTVQFICVILIHNERVWVEKTVINTKFTAYFLGKPVTKALKCGIITVGKSKGVTNL